MCFEVAYDGLVRDLVDGGADVIVVPTNNATYTGTGQIEQQFAMSRLRAIETGRYVVVASTNGISGVVAPGRHVVERAPERRQAVLEQQVRAGARRDPGRSCSAPGRSALLSAIAAGRGPGRRAGRLSSPSPGSGRRTGAQSGDERRHDDDAALGRVLMVIPTYNERDNLEWIVGRVAGRGPAVDVLVVDDGSPDGTGEIADELAAADPQVTVLHRTEKAGLGAAYLARLPGRARARLRRGRRDGRRRLAPARAAARCCWPRCEDADLVIGSRWVPGGSVVNWPLRRKVLSRRRQPLRPAAARHPAARRRPPATGCSAVRRWRRIDLGTRASRPATLPDRPGLPHASGPACGWSRCRSSSSSGSAASPR